MRALRWLLLVPASIAAVAVFQRVVQFGFYRYGLPVAFWFAADMGDWWIIGTLGLIVLRGGSGALSTWAVFRVAPNHKIGAARAWIGLLVALAVFWVGSIAGALRVSEVSMSVDHWYRFFIEVGALLGGALLTYLSMRDRADVLDSYELEPQRAPSPETFCRSCGALVDQDNRFCVACGSEMYA